MRALAFVAVAALAALAALAAGCQEDSASAPISAIDAEGMGFKAIDQARGTGAEAVAGKRVSVHYTGKFQNNGKKFDSSLDRGRPFEFTLGAGQVIKGWDMGVVGMKVGGKRQLICPPAFAYGADGRPPQIPPSSTLVFDVELLGVQ